MKKYVKPELFYEHYELSQHIADCDFEYIQAQDSCAALGDVEDELDHILLFNNNNDLCNTPPEVIDKFCYHGSTTGSSTFNS